MSEFDGRAICSLAGHRPGGLRDGATLAARCCTSARRAICGGVLRATSTGGTRAAGSNLMVRKIAAHRGAVLPAPKPRPCCWKTSGSRLTSRASTSTCVTTRVIPGFRIDTSHDYPRIGFLSRQTGKAHRGAISALTPAAGRCVNRSTRFIRLMGLRQCRDTVFAKSHSTLSAIPDQSLLGTLCGLYQRGGLRAGTSMLLSSFSRVVVKRCIEHLGERMRTGPPAFRSRSSEKAAALRDQDIQTLQRVRSQSVCNRWSGQSGRDWSLATSGGRRRSRWSSSVMVEKHRRSLLFPPPILAEDSGPRDIMRCLSWPVTMLKSPPAENSAFPSAGQTEALRQEALGRRPARAGWLIRSRARVSVPKMGWPWLKPMPTTLFDGVVRARSDRPRLNELAE